MTEPNAYDATVAAEVHAAREDYADEEAEAAELEVLRTQPPSDRTEPR